MGYAIHVTRRSPSGQTMPIALSEWRAVVERTTGVRMANGDFQATNPTTAEVIRNFECWWRRRGLFSDGFNVAACVSLVTFRPYLVRGT